MAANLIYIGLSLLNVILSTRYDPLQKALGLPGELLFSDVQTENFNLLVHEANLYDCLSKNEDVGLKKVQMSCNDVYLREVSFTV